MNYNYQNQQAYSNPFYTTTGYPPPQGPPPNQFNTYPTGQVNMSTYPPQQQVPEYGNAAYATLNSPVQAPGADTKFKPVSQLRDVWALFVYLGALVGFFVVLGLNLYRLNWSQFGSSDFLSVPSEVYLISLIGGTILSFLTSAVYIFLMQMFPGPVIKVSFWAHCLLYICMGLLLLSSYSNPLNLVVGILMVFGGILYAFLWFSWRSRIPFSTIMLANVTRFVRKYWGTLVQSLVLAIVALLFYILWTFTLISVFFNYSASQCYTNQNGQTVCGNTGELWVIVIFLFFVLYWTSQLIKDVGHIAVSGAFAADYFFPDGEKFPAVSAFKRACTTSLGSACFGSLLIAVIQTLRTIVHMVRGQHGGVVMFVGCCIECMLGAFQGLIDYFNTYAYTYCAMYGQPYLTAGKSTWALIKDRGIDAIVNDVLIGNVLTLGGFIVGGLSALLALIVIVIKVPTYMFNYGFIIVVLLNLAIGSLLFNIVASVIESCNVTFFVCLAEDPRALQVNNPGLYNRIRDAYPQVAIPV